jgi:integrase
MSEPERIRVGDRVTIYPRGKKQIWCADFWRDGQHLRQSLKTRNKKVAIERATKLAATLVDGSYHRPLPSVTIEEAVANYLEHLQTEERAPKTLTKYRGIFERFVAYLRTLDVTGMAQFAATHLDKYRALRKKTRHAKTVYTEGVVIKQLFRWAKRRKLIQENPVEDIQLAKPRLVPKGGPSLPQIDAILAACEGKFQAMIATLAFTGMRSGELQRLRVEDVDLAGGWMHVVSRRGAETKTRQSRKVPIHPRLRQILATLPRSVGPWFFTAEPSSKYPKGDHWIATKKLNDRFLAKLKKLNLPTGRESGYVIHSLRHSFETITINSGIPQRVVDAWLGHTSDRSMGAVYYHLSEVESQRFINLVPFGTHTSDAKSDQENAS